MKTKASIVIMKCGLILLWLIGNVLLVTMLFFLLGPELSISLILLVIFIILSVIGLKFLKKNKKI